MRALPLKLGREDIEQQIDRSEHAPVGEAVADVAAVPASQHETLLTQQREVARGQRLARADRRREVIHRACAGAQLDKEQQAIPITQCLAELRVEAEELIASLVRGTAPKVAYGGRVMCFLETGGGRATALRFDYEHPPVPPQPSRLWHWAKWAFNRAYWVTVPQGRVR